MKMEVYAAANDAEVRAALESCPTRRAETVSAIAVRHQKAPSEDLEAVAMAINNRPRKVLGWPAPAEVFEEQLRSLQQPDVATTG